jgi:hypothetical protein
MWLCSLWKLCRKNVEELECATEAQSLMVDPGGISESQDTDRNVDSDGWAHEVSDEKLNQRPCMPQF